MELQFYEDDNLSSPPSSKGSEVDVTYDPLLDFSRDDDMVHHRGNQTADKSFASNVKQMQKEMEVSMWACVHMCECVHVRVGVCVGVCVCVCVCVCV